jgi:hypothetical protein
MKHFVIWVGVLATLAATSAWGDSPPSWRGTLGTTYEQWDFANSNNPVAPDSFSNSYGTPSASINYNPPFGTGWYDTLPDVYGAVQGFWDIGKGAIALTVPAATNTLSTVAKEIIQVQVTYFISPFRRPKLSVPNGTQIGSTTTIPGEYGTVGEWFTDVSTWQLTNSANPNIISVLADTNKGSMIEQVIVDTQMTNLPPVATDLTLARTAGLSLKIFWSDVTNHWSDVNGNVVTLASFNLTSTNSVTVSTNGQLILYPKTAANLNDRITYTISDGQGGTNVGYINVVVNSSVTGTNSITQIVSGNPTTLTAYGLPGYNYIAQRSTNLVNWVDFSTNSAASNGVITVVDQFIDLGGIPPSSAYYRLKWNGN